MQLKMIRSKLNFKLFLLIITSLLCLNSYVGTTKEKSSFITLGNENAPVKIKIFSSFTCPHCANFHIKIFPEIKENYVESGKVQMIFIDFPLDQSAFNASKLLHCLDKEKQIAFMDTIYEKQSLWTSGNNEIEINDNLKTISKNFGIDSVQFNKCLNDNIISDRILNGRIDAQKKYSINSTPTIVINEKKFTGDVSFKNLQKKIEKLI